MENLMNDEYLIEEVLDMSPPRPTTNHMELMSEIWLQFKNYFGKKCMVANESSLYLTKEDISIFKNDIAKLINLYKNTKETIPDIAVYCDKNQRFLKGYVGVPQIVVEVLSPSNSTDDTEVKKQIYENFGVLEYWIVDPQMKQVFIHVIDGSKYELKGTYNFIEEEIKSIKFDNLVVDIKDIELV